MTKTHLLLPQLTSLTRRRFVFGSAAMLSSSSLLAGLSGSAWGQIVAEDDSRIQTRELGKVGGEGDLYIYMATPANVTQKLKPVLLIHDSRGLRPHFKDIARRLAVEGFAAFAPDFLSSEGGTHAIDEERNEKFLRRMNPDKTVDIAVGVTNFIKGLQFTSDKVGGLGFEWGGEAVSFVAVATDALAACVSFYSTPPKLSLVKHITARMMVHHPMLDRKLATDNKRFEAELKKRGIDHQFVNHESADRHFFDDTSSGNYREEPAKEAWKQTVEFLKETLV